MNPVIAALVLSPPPLIANIHSVWSSHTLYALNDDCSHVTTLYTPSMEMSPMDLHYSPLNDDGSHIYLQYVPPQWLCLPHDEE